MVTWYIRDAEHFDFNLAPEKVPAEWAALQEETCSLLRGIGIWRGDLVAVWDAEQAG